MDKSNLGGTYSKSIWSKSVRRKERNQEIEEEDLIEILQIDKS